MRIGLHDLTLDLGNDTAILVPVQDVERCGDVESARRLLSHANPHASALRALAGDAGGDDGLADDDEVIDAVAQLIASGRYVVVRLRRPHADTSGRRGGPDGTLDDWSNAPLLSDLLPRNVVPTTTWIEIRCVGRRGQSYGGWPVRVRLPDGEVRELPLDGDSCVRIDGIDDGGTCWVELPDDPKRRRGPPRPVAPRRETSATLLPGGRAVGVTTAKIHIVVVEDVPYAHSW